MDNVRRNIAALIGDRTIKQVGQDSGVGQSWLQRYMNPHKASGIEKANPEKLKLLAKYFRVPFEAIIAGDPTSGVPASQPARLDPEILSRAYTEVVGIFDLEAPGELDLSTPSHAALLCGLYDVIKANNGTLSARDGHALVMRIKAAFQGEDGEPKRNRGNH